MITKALRAILINPLSCLLATNQRSRCQRLAFGLQPQRPKDDVVSYFPVDQLSLCFDRGGHKNGCSGYDYES